MITIYKINLKNPNTHERKHMVAWNTHAREKTGATSWTEEQRFSRLPRFFLKLTPILFTQTLAHIYTCVLIN